MSHELLERALHPTSEQTTYPVLLYDGDCGMCSALVQFVLAHESEALFRFVALQSSEGIRLATRHGVPNDLSTAAVVFRKSGPGDTEDTERVLLRSDAILFVFRRLRQPWRALGSLTWVPRTIRDAVYRFVARNRLRWFGQPDSCVLPDASTRARFVTDDPDSAVARSTA